MRNSKIKITALSLTLILMFGVFGGSPVSAAENPTLSLEQATARALESSVKIKKAQTDIDKADYEFQRAMSNVSMVPTSPWQDANASAIYQGYMLAQENYFSKKTAYNLSIEQLIHSTKIAYFDIQKKTQAKEVAELAFKQAERELRIANLKQNYGMMSAFGQRQAVINRNTKSSELSSAKKSLDNAWVSFRNLIGAKTGENFILSDKLEYEALEMSEANMFAHAASISGHEYLTYLAEFGAASAKISYDYFYPTTTASYQATEKGLQSANYAVTLTKEGYEQAVREMYYSIRQLENSYEIMLSTRDQLQESLRLAELQFKLGMIAELDLEATRLQLKELEKTIQAMEIDHSLLLQSFLKPWLSSAS